MRNEVKLRRIHGMTNIRSIRSSHSVVLALALLQLAFASQRVDAAPDYWLCGEDPVVQKDKNKSCPADYMDLFRLDSPWSSSAAKLKGFKISTQLVLRGTDEQLKTVIEGLKARHIPMSIEMGLLVY
jgi:hypothetical protein